ncbi:hypothetical protein EVJ58_g7879 [Rhodofomes roseus]|uniref:SigF-like NTF2-like domain-containing protein n=1 Tax=Rhodofomes roseus TaxID=34475 RepID=A0A4Y9Y0M1_9APHY|nr:hypothetical protein EVJ58_g7879 [Rhodofomes roseus]
MTRYAPWGVLLSGRYYCNIWVAEDDSSVTSPGPGLWLLIPWISDAGASEGAATRDVTSLSPPSQRAIHSRLSPFLRPPSLDLQQPNVDHPMENPAAEIEDVILAITASLNPDVQRAAIYRYFAPDAELVVVGLESDFCVRATCSAALARGNDVLLIRGAHATYDRIEYWDGGTSTPAEKVQREIEEELEEAGVVLLDMADLPSLFGDR